MAAKGLSAAPVSDGSWALVSSDSDDSPRALSAPGDGIVPNCPSAARKG